MANMAVLMLVVFAIQIAMFGYLGSAGLPTDMSIDIFNFLKSPTGWASNPFMIVITALTFTSAAVIVVGTFLTRSDIVIFAALAGTILSFGYPLATLFVKLQSVTGSVFPSMIFIGPIILIYVMVAVQWFRIGALP